MNNPTYTISTVHRTDAGPVATQIAERGEALSSLLDEYAPQAPKLGHMQVFNAYGELVAVIYEDGGVDRIAHEA